MGGGGNRQQAIVLPPRRMDLDAWLAWMQKNLKKTDTPLRASLECGGRILSSSRFNS